MRYLSMGTQFNKCVPVRYQQVHLSLEHEPVTYKWEPKFNKCVPVRYQQVHLSLEHEPDTYQ
ncbi:MAG: hypothetical protein Fur006_65380 [Coleofasciculaceae cyanobacterium]